MTRLTIRILASNAADAVITGVQAHAGQRAQCALVPLSRREITFSRLEVTDRCNTRLTAAIAEMARMPQEVYTMVRDPVYQSTQAAHEECSQLMRSKILNIAPVWIAECALLYGLHLLFASSLDKQGTLV
jgi:hypothetical protein